MAKTNGRGSTAKLPKAPTGIQGLDEITGGGLPRGRPTLVCGAAGCGKTLLAMEFLVRGAIEFGEPGVFMAFEETSEELAANVRSLGFDLDELVAQKKLARRPRPRRAQRDRGDRRIRPRAGCSSASATRSTRSAPSASCSIRSRRCSAGFDEPGDPARRAAAAVSLAEGQGRHRRSSPAERGDGTLTRQGLEEYVSDCVILLDHRVTDQVSTRRLRIVKYRGTAHGTNEYPFLIDEHGISVLPDHLAGPQPRRLRRADLDRRSRASTRCWAARAIYRGSSVLVSGTAGTGKTSLAAHFAARSCAAASAASTSRSRSPTSQIVRNMRSIGIDLRPWIKKGLLQVRRRAADRCTAWRCTWRLMHRAIRQFQPRMVVVDPISNLADGGELGDAARCCMRLIDFLKTRQITAVLHLADAGRRAEGGDARSGSRR